MCFDCGGLYQKPARKAGSPREHLAWGAIKGWFPKMPSLTVGLLIRHKDDANS